MGALKFYNVGGLDVLGTGKPAPEDTVLRLSDREAERLGLKKAAAKDDGDAKAKPRKASTRKRPAPAAAPEPRKATRTPRKRA